jgi:hypothetical protein
VRTAPNFFAACAAFALLVSAGSGLAADQEKAAGAADSPPLGRVRLSADGKGFTVGPDKTPYRPWGMNYGNKGRLMEDFWENDWATLEDDLRELSALGANCVRIHLQFGKFMSGPDKPIAAALDRLRRLLDAAEKCRVHVDITGLACYRPADIPAWYDALGETDRWKTQAEFWAAVAKTCSGHRAVFCYDLINEPLSPAAKREPGKWRSGSLFGEFDFLQYIALDPAGRKREDIAAAWIRTLTAAIRRHDKETLITVGLLPWVRDWKHLSGFLPETVAPELDFISVHLYPDPKKPGEALESLEKFAVGKPVVIEETFPLHCRVEELEKFLRESKKFACGWLGHYDGQPIAELDALERSGKLTLPQAIYRDWLRMFVRLRPEFRLP